MFSKELIAFLLAAIIATYVIPSPVTSDDAGILRPAETGVVVVVDMDRNNVTSRNIGTDVRVAGAVVSVTYTDGAVALFATDTYGIAEIEMSIVASMDVICPALTGHTEAWMCGDDLPVNPSGWTPVFVPPVVGYLPVVH